MTEQRMPVSQGGGTEPACRRDGQVILYVKSDRLLMAVPVTKAGGTLTLGKPTPLFRLPAHGAGSSTWSPTGDHTKFVVIDEPNAKRQTFKVMTGW